MATCSNSLCLLAMACSAFAQGPFKPVTLSVVATDRAGNPVTDLQPADLRIVDDGAPAQVASLRLSPPNPAPTVVVLLDLMDLDFAQRGYVAKQLRASVVRQPGAPPSYLYVLGADGHVYVAPGATNSTAAFDLAIQQAPQQRPIYFRQHPEERFKSAYDALSFLDRDLREMQGSKQLIWITDGIPDQVRFQGRGWTDLSPYLRQMAANLNRDRITVYTLDPSLALATLNRRGLEVITGATGGRTFASSDLTLVLNQTRVDPASTYILEYPAPLSGNNSGKLHTVRISSDRKGVSVRAQLAYMSEAAIN